MQTATVGRAVSSAPVPGSGSVPDATLTGRIDAALGPLCDTLEVDPSDTVAYLCGHPAMIAAGEGILAARGFPRDAIRSEHYWPAGSPARA